MSIKYNEFGEVISVNGLTTGHHLGAPMQDALGTEEENSAYGTDLATIGSSENVVDDLQPEQGGSGGGSGGNTGGVDLVNEWGAGVGMFYGSYSFCGVDFVKSVTASYCTAVHDHAFAGSSVEAVNLGFRVSSIVNRPTCDLGEGAFMGCEKLRTVSVYYLDALDDHVFDGCKNLESVEMTIAVNQSGAVQNITIGDCAFRNCTKLTEFLSTNGGFNAKIIGNNAFEGCERLERVWVEYCEYVYMKAFAGCTSLTTVILDGETVCQVELDAFENTPMLTGEGHIYVRANMYEAYRAAYEAALDQLMPGFFDILFRKIEDYPEICG